MERVFSIDDMPWADLKGLPGARGFEFKALTDDAYTKAYSCELVRLDPGDHSVQTDEDVRTGDAAHPATTEQTRTYCHPVQLYHGRKPETHPDDGAGGANPFVREIVRGVCR